MNLFTIVGPLNFFISLMGRWLIYRGVWAMVRSLWSNRLVAITVSHPQSKNVFTKSLSKMIPLVSLVHPFMITSLLSSHIIQFIFHILYSTVTSRTITVYRVGLSRSPTLHEYTTVQHHKAPTLSAALRYCIRWLVDEVAMTTARGHTTTFGYS